MLFDGPEEESTLYVRDLVFNRGWIVTNTQLIRWRSWGLLSKATQRGAGRGSVVFHPRGTAQQAATIFQLLCWNRSHEAALWKLYLNGFPVDEKQPFVSS